MKMEVGPTNSLSATGLMVLKNNEKIVGSEKITWELQNLRASPLTC